MIVGGDVPGRQINFLRETVRANGGPRQLTGSATTPKLLKMPPLFDVPLFKLVAESLQLGLELAVLGLELSVMSCELFVGFLSANGLRKATQADRRLDLHVEGQAVAVQCPSPVLRCLSASRLRQVCGRSGW